MDIKEVLGVKVLYLVDHGTRCSVAVKLSSTDITAFFRHGMTYFEALLSVLGKFNNQYFYDPKFEYNHLD